MFRLFLKEYIKGGRGGYILCIQSSMSSSFLLYNRSKLQHLDRCYKHSDRRYKHSDKASFPYLLQLQFLIATLALWHMGKHEPVNISLRIRRKIDHFWKAKILCTHNVSHTSTNGIPSLNNKLVVLVCEQFIKFSTMRFPSFTPPLSCLWWCSSWLVWHLRIVESLPG